MKTSNLWWITVTLVFSLPAPSSAAVDQNKLVGLVKAIKKMKDGYDITAMYSVAVSLPKDHWYDLNQVTKPTEEEGKNIASGDLVFNNNRLAIATVKAPEHAEWRLLNTLHLDSNEGDLLVIFSYGSPCPNNCANPNDDYTIIKKINAVISGGKWGDKVFVFEKIYKPKIKGEIPRDQLETAVRNLGTSSVGLANIFRCFKPNEVNFRCTSCSDGGGVADDCVNYKA